MTAVRRRKRINYGAWLLGAAYVFSAYWVFTRSTPVIQHRPVTIRIAHWQIERGPPDGIAAVIKRYEELNPRVHVIQQMVPGGMSGGVYTQWARANLIGDEGSDIIEWGMYQPGQRDLPGRYFEPLTGPLKQVNPYNRGTSQEKIPWEKTFDDELAGPKRDSPDPGQIYAIAVSGGAVRLFCNIELLKKITGSEAAPRNFDELRTIFAKIKRYSAAQKETISGLAGSRDNGLWIVETVIGTPTLDLVGLLDDPGYRYLYRWQLLAAYLDRRWNYARPDVKAGIELVREVSQATKPGFLQLRRDDAMMEFFNGNAVFLYTGSWDATSLRREAPFKVVPMVVPQPNRQDPRVGKFIIGPGGEGRGETGFTFYLNKNGAHKEEALDFMRFLTSVPGNQLFTDASLWLPSINDVKVPDEIKSFKQYQQGYAFGQAPVNSIGQEQNREWIQNFYKLVGDQGGVDQFVMGIEAVMPKAIRADLQSEYRNTFMLVRPQDGLIVARAHLADCTPAGLKYKTRQTESEMGQTQSEGLAYQMKYALDRTENER